MLKRIRNWIQRRRVVMYDRPAYSQGWKDGHQVGKRLGYQTALNDLRAGNIAPDSPTAGLDGLIKG